MLVEGDTVEVTVNGKMTAFHFAETFVIPASVENYSVNYRGKGEGVSCCGLDVKDECCF